MCAKRRQTRGGLDSPPRINYRSRSGPAAVQSLTRPVEAPMARDTKRDVVIWFQAVPTSPPVNQILRIRLVVSPVRGPLTAMETSVSSDRTMTSRRTAMGGGVPRGPTLPSRMTLGRRPGNPPAVINVIWVPVLIPPLVVHDAVTATAMLAFAARNRTGGTTGLYRGRADAPGFAPTAVVSIAELCWRADHNAPIAAVNRTGSGSLHG